MTPSALAAHNRAAEKSLRRMAPGVVIIDGQEYNAGVLLGPLDWMPQGGGTVRIQQLFFNLAKDLFPDRPQQKQPVTFEGVEFKVADVGGLNTTDPAWIVTANRFPK